MLVSFAGLQFELSEEWRDITDDLPEGTPWTLAREDGIGAIQFSAATYKSGEHPALTAQDLREMLDGLFAAHNVVGFEPLDTAGCQMLCAGGKAVEEDALVAAWYLSNGTDVALITYVGAAANPATAIELSDAAALVKTAQFA
jgi:hypothetical protein